MNTKQTLAELSEWAGEEFIEEDDWREYDGNSLAYCLNQAGEIISLRVITSRIKDLSPLSQLTSLQHLDCSHTQISDLSPLSQLVQLEEVSLFNTKVSDLSPLLNLKHLKLVDAYGCQIVNLPRKITGFNLPFILDERVEGVALTNNPLENPPIEVIGRGNAAVESYFDSLKGELKPLNEVKVILVGEGAAGKTSVVNRLIHNTFDQKERMTDGIKITPWQIKAASERIKANVWDFGGQEIMRATHQLFLSKRCIYLLVLDGRKDERPEHWLKQILSVTSEAKILVVCNKIDENPDNNLQRQHLKEKYPQIVGFYPLSCQTEHGIAPLKTQLTELIVDLPMRRIELAANWVKVKQQLESWAGDRDFISHEKFVDLCVAQNVESDVTQEVLLDLLHDLGLVIHFKALQHLQTQVLNPRWITEGIYALITSKELTQQGGLLAEAEAEDILKAKVKHYSYQHKVHFLMRVMEQFELCYCIGEPQNQYLVPSLLPVELADAPPNLRGDTISFIFKYEGFMPPQIMPRFIVKSHKDIDAGQSWRSGVILHNKGLSSSAKVVADAEEGEISIIVVGEQRRDFFAVLRDYFDKIHQNYDQQNLGLKPLVVIKSDDNSSRVDYHRLIKLEQHFLAGKHDGMDYDSILDIEFLVVDVLNGLGTSESRQAEREQLSMGKIGKMNKHDTPANIHISFNPTMTQNQHNDQQNDQQSDQQNDQQQKVSQQVSISVEIKSLSGKFENWAEDLLEDLPSLGANLPSNLSPELQAALSSEQNNQQIEKEVIKVQKALKEITSVEAQDEAEGKISKFERVNGFITDAINGENKTGQLLQAAGQSVKKLQDIGKQYNKIASHFGLPVVPDVLL